jgi:hypothetical protein
MFFDGIVLKSSLSVTKAYSLLVTRTLRSRMNLAMSRILVNGISILEFARCGKNISDPN